MYLGSTKYNWSNITLSNINYMYCPRHKALVHFQVCLDADMHCFLQEEYQFQIKFAKLYWLFQCDIQHIKCNHKIIKGTNVWFDY